MRTVRISDITLRGTAAGDLTFREKIEIAGLLDRLAVSVIELGMADGQTAGNLLIKSVVSAVTDSTVAVCPGLDPATITAVWEALRQASHPRLQVRAAVSTARMEYVYHKKADKMQQAAEEALRICRSLCDDVEFIAEDATRADTDYLCSVIQTAIAAGAGTVTLSDSAGVMLPDEFGAFIRMLYDRIPSLRDVTLGVCCSDNLTVANAVATAAIAAGAGEIKAAATAEDTVTLQGIVSLLTTKGETLGASCKVRTTELNRLIQDIARTGNKKISGSSPFEDGVRSYPTEVSFTAHSTVEELNRGAVLLGYDLSDEDQMQVYHSLCDIVQKKESVSLNELDAIIAAKAMQVPATYVLESYVVTTGNAVDIIAHVKLRRDDEIFHGLSLGDGPIDAAFLAIEKITGHHYELDDFQIQSVTEGREAMGQTVVKLRSGGKIYSGKGLSTDIIGSSVSAYINALNKILYEEERL